MPEEAATVGARKSPQLLYHKPSKGEVKKAKGSARPPTMDPSSGSTTTTTTSTPPPAPKRTLLRRLIPLLLAANFAVGAYVLLRTTDKMPTEEGEHLEEAPAATVPVKEDTRKTPETQPKPSVPAPIKVLLPVPEDEQRKLFRWMLEEKRKIKTTSSQEKKKINEEKALLKRYIRVESFPSI